MLTSECTPTFPCETGFLIVQMFLLVLSRLDRKWWVETWSLYSLLTIEPLIIVICRLENAQQRVDLQRGQTIQFLSSRNITDHVSAPNCEDFFPDSSLDKSCGNQLSSFCVILLTIKPTWTALSGVPTSTNSPLEFNQAPPKFTHS